MEEAPISPPSPRSPVQEDAPMAPGEASAQEEKENTKQESIDNIVQAIRDECLVPSPILKGVPLPDVPSALLLIGRKYNTLTEANQGLREECEHLRKKCAEECEPKYDILKKKYTDEREERKRLYNEVIELKGNIRVYCRCRPLSLEEIAKGSSCVVDFDPAHDTELRIICTDSSKKQFKFDHIFGHKDDQDAVFKETLPIVKSVLDGFNVCIFAYGQTGSGKTFTMEGIPENRGVNYRALDELFKISGQRSSLMRYEFYVSMLEVYNEKIRDLLADSPDQLSKRLDIKQASDGTQDVPGLLEPQVGSIDEVWEILTNGGRNRSVGSTNANELSSRSHSLVRVTIKGESFVDGQKFTSRLWLVDLAGSERLGKIEVEGERLKESQFINKSLSALGDVISALASKNPHIPYRNSKLTHLLQSSLGGDCKTLMFAQISPSSADLGETLCSLNFASRVRGIEHGPVRKQTDFAESFKLKQMADKLLQSEKENIRLNESLQLMQLKYASRENVFKTLQDKIISNVQIREAEQTSKNYQQKVRELENQLNGDRTTKKDAAKFPKPPVAPLRGRPPLQRITNQLSPSGRQTSRGAHPVIDKENSLLTNKTSGEDLVKSLHRARRITLAPVMRNVPAQPKRRASIAILQDTTQRAQALPVARHQNISGNTQFSHLMIPKRRSLASFTPIRGSLGAATTPDKSNFSTLASSSKYRSPSRFQAFSKSMIPTFSSPHQRLRLTSSPTNAEHLDGAHQTTNKLCFSVQKRVIVSSPARPKQFMHQGHTMFNQVLRGGNLVGRLQGTAQRVLCKNKRRSVI
ncbi:kinesin-like protein KIN-14J isoform X1 [Zingiber officinale]|uniref:kinesin-like protein KIN-14J isoform X1 n=1 Tax=Zingiber officinale TaxID=94328 RepID=UPI001C4ABE6E|nr:kinesin-like protein KIN-14J isoform X1 [Zingiber officinale]